MDIKHNGMEVMSEKNNEHRDIKGMGKNWRRDITEMEHIWHGT